MNIFMYMMQINLRNEDRIPSNTSLAQVAQYDPETNTSEGGEFLDDAIRIVDQPFYDLDNA